MITPIATTAEEKEDLEAQTQSAHPTESDGVKKEIDCANGEGKSIEMTEVVTEKSNM